MYVREWEREDQRAFKFSRTKLKKLATVLLLILLNNLIIILYNVLNIISFSWKFVLGDDDPNGSANGSDEFRKTRHLAASEHYDIFLNSFSLYFLVFFHIYFCHERLEKQFDGIELSISSSFWTSQEILFLQNYIFSTLWLCYSSTHIRARKHSKQYTCVYPDDRSISFVFCVFSAIIIIICLIDKLFLFFIFLFLYK